MFRRLSAIAVALVALAVMPAAIAQVRSLAMLDDLETGRWEVRMRDGSGRTYPMCVDDARKLLQLRHPGLACERVIVSDTPGEVTVQYTCRGAGYGRTTVRKETSRLVQLQSQGIAEGLPFDFTAEARRTGGC